MDSARISLHRHIPPRGEGSASCVQSPVYAILLSLLEVRVARKGWLRTSPRSVYGEAIPGCCQGFVAEYALT